MAKALTVTAIENLKATTSRQEIADGHTAGLYFVLQPSGKAGWAVRYKIKNTRTNRKLTIGAYPAISLRDARIRASKALVLVAEGGDPAGEKQAARRHDKQARSDTVASLVERYTTVYLKRSVVSADGTKRPKLRSWPETKRILDREIVATWGQRPIASITRREVHTLLESVVGRGSPIMANRVLAALRPMCAWAVEHDIIAASPCDGVKAKSAESSRDRVLQDDELRMVWNACDQIGPPFAPLVRLLMLTGQRRDEVAEMRWAEIDFDSRTWTIPRERVKNGAVHIVPLSAQALAIIRIVKRVESEAGFVFTTGGETAVSGFSKAKQRLDAAIALKGTAMPSWRLHDLRRSFVSGCASLGVALPVVERAVNHLSGSFGGIQGIYQRHDFMTERRAAMEAWGRHIESLSAGRATNVIEMKAVR